MPNQIFEWAKIEPRTVIAGFHGRFVHSATMTFALWDIDAGALLPEHSHHHEQVVHLYEGEFELTVEGEPILATPGTVFAIPPNARHSGRALSACRIMDVFYPVREDYRDGAGPTIIGDAVKSG